MPRRILSLFRNLLRKQRGRAGIGRRTPVFRGNSDGGEDEGGVFAIGSPPTGAHGTRRRGASQGGGPRHTGWALSGGPRQGRPFRIPHSGQVARLHCRGCADVVAGHRGQYRHLQHCPRLYFQPAALPPRGAGRPGLYAGQETSQQFPFLLLSHLHRHPRTECGRAVFSGVLAHNMAMVSIGEGETSRRTFVALVSSNYFRTLEVPLLRGRAFLPEEETPGSAVPVVIASYLYWKNTGFDPQLVGKAIRVNERPFTVVGITPEHFTGTMMIFGPGALFPPRRLRPAHERFRSPSQAHPRTARWLCSPRRWTPPARRHRRRRGGCPPDRRHQSRKGPAG